MVYTSGARSEGWAFGLSSGQYWLLVLGLLFVAAVVLLPRGLLAPFLQLPLPRALRRFDPLKKPSAGR